MRLWPAAAALLLVIACARIASTYMVFSATVDEPMHISAGLQLLQEHLYTYQPENPPFPRIVFTALPWIGGLEFDPSRRVDEQLIRVFYSGGPERYTTNLFLARVGNLFFFALGTFAVWIFAQRELGKSSAAVAILLFTAQPMIIGHSGLATHDAAATASVALALLAFSWWLECPVHTRAMALGAAYGFAAICKFSCIAYVPAACFAIGAVRLFRDAELRRRWSRLLFTIPTAAAFSVFVLWAGYGFTFDRQALVPAPAFFRGLQGLMGFEREGYASYFFGEQSTSGWWWYFPAAVLLKTPIPFLILIGLAWLARRERIVAESAAAAAAILAVAAPSSLDLGVRYVLPLYVPLTFIAAATVKSMLQQQRRWLRALGIVLTAWHVGESVAAHPDYFPYFNQIAGRDPSRYLIDSNLDWGQDGLRLATALKQEKIDSVALDLMGWHDLDALGFPAYRQARWFLPSSGWVAVSDHPYRLARGHDGYRWLEERPYQRVGTSVRLYYIDPRVRRERVLLPLWFEGTMIGGDRWACELTVRNENDHPITLWDSAWFDAAMIAEIPARAVTVNPPLGVAARHGAILFVDRAEAGKVRFSLKVHSSSGLFLEVPVPRERDFRTAPIHFPELALDGRRVTLRVYDLTGEAAAVTVRFDADDGSSMRRTVPMTRGGQSPAHPPAIEVAVSDLFPKAAGRRIRLAVEPPSAMHWAFLSVVDERGAYVVLPQ